MNNKKKAINLLILLIFLLAIPVLIVVVQRVVELRSRAAGSGTMALTGPTSASPGQGFDVIVTVNSGGSSIKSRGVDVMITFPTDKLTLNSIAANAASSTALKTFVPVTSASPYDFDSSTVIANANSSGTLSFGAVPVVKTSPLPPAPTPPFQPGTGTADSFTGSIPTLATLHFTVKNGVSGSAAISFSHTVNNRNDSNIAGYDLDANGAAIDLLNTVTNLTVNIGGAATATPTGASCPNGNLGNLNCSSDGAINIWDLSIMSAWWGKAPLPTIAPGNVTADIASGPSGSSAGKVDIWDLSAMSTNWTK